MENTNRPLSIKEAMEFTGYSRSYLYQLIHYKKIPCHKPTGGRVFFKRSELEDFIFSGKISSTSEMSVAADTILNGEA